MKRVRTPFTDVSTLQSGLMRLEATVLYVNDVSAAIASYRRAFGVPLRFHDEILGFAELEMGGTILAIASHSIAELLMPGRYCPPENGRPAGVELAFLTDDVSAAFAKVIAEGATPIAAPKRMPWGLEVAYAQAPDGTILGFSEPPAG